MRVWKWIRRLLFLAIGLAIATCVIFIVGQSYVRRKLVEELSRFNSGPVKVERLQIGWERQRVEGIQFLEPNDEGSAWLTVSSAEADLSIRDIISGVRRPSAITVRDPRVVLRLNEDGELLTPLPQPSGEQSVDLPADDIQLTGASLEIRQVNRPPFVVDEVDVQVRQSAEQVLAEGAVPRWFDSAWSFKGTLDRTTGRVSVESQADEIHVRSEELSALPLIPPRAFDGLDFEVRTSVNAKVAWSPDAKPNYSLRLVPRTYQLSVAGQPLDLAGEDGELTVENGVAEIKEARANLYGGTVVLGGRLDTREKTWKGRVEATVEAVNVNQLSAALQLPQEASGRASGKLSADFEWGDKGRRISGRGEGAVEQAVVRGVPLASTRMTLDFSQNVSPPNGIAQPGNDAGKTHATWNGKLLLETAVKDVSVERIAQQLGLEDAADRPRLRGRLTGRGTLELPLAKWQEPLAWALSGDATIVQAQLGQFDVRRMSGKVDYQQGRVRLEDLHADLADKAALDGQLDVNLLDERPTLKARLEARNVDASLITKAWSKTTPVEGSLSGRTELEIPLRDWDDVAAWHAVGNVSADRLQFSRLQFEKPTVRFELQANQFVVPDVSTRWQGVPLTGDLKLGLAAPLPLKATLRAEDVDPRLVAEFLELGSEAIPTGGVDFQVSLSGNVGESEWNAEGRATSERLVWRDWTIADAACEWSLDREKATITRLGAKLLEGRVELTGTIPFDDAATGRISGNFAGISASVLAERLAPDAPVQVAGTIDGQVQLENLRSPEKRQAKLTFSGLSAKASGVTAETLRGEIKYAGGRVDVDVRGEAFDGNARFQGRMLTPAGKLSDARFQGQLSLESLGIQSLARQFGSRLRLLQSSQLQSVRGRLSAELNVEAEGPGFRPSGSGRLTAVNVLWKNDVVTRRAECDVSVKKGVARLTNISTRFADGQVKGELLLRIKRPATGEFTFQIDRASLERLAKLLPDDPPNVDGSLSGVVRGRLGSQWSGTGELRLQRAQVLGVAVDRVRAPLDWSYVPATSSLQTKLRITTARFARGRLSGELQARWSGRWDVKGDVKLVNADVRGLTRAVPGVRNSLSGRCSGVASFEGRRIRSIDSFTADVEGSLAQAQTLALPVFENLTTSLGLGSPAGQTFAETAFKGRLRRGIFFLDRLTMRSPNSQLYVEGKVTTRGLLDLDVTADMANLAATGVVLGVLRPLDFLRRRLIFLHIGGSIRSPSVHPRTEAFIEQEIVLFFLPLANYGATP